jgi:hypothetical protein
VGGTPAYQITFDIPCNYQTYLIWGETGSSYCYYSDTYSAVVDYLMPWSQGGDEVPLNITLTVNASRYMGSGAGVFSAPASPNVDGYYVLNITNPITGQSYAQRVPQSGTTTLASGTCTTTTKTVSGTYTEQQAIYPNGTPVVVQGSIYVNGKKVYYGPIQLINDSGQLYIKDNYISSELYFTANNPIGSIQNGTLQINVETSTSYTTSCVNLWAYGVGGYGVPSVLPCVPTVIIVTGTKNYTAYPWSPIAYNTTTVNYTETYYLTFINIFPGGGTYYYSLYPFQAPVLAFTDHDPSAGPKYAS